MKSLVIGILVIPDLLTNVFVSGSPTAWRTGAQPQAERNTSRIWHLRGWAALLSKIHS